MKTRKQGYQRSSHMKTIKEQTKPVDEEVEEVPAKDTAEVKDETVIQEDKDKEAQ